MRLEVPFHFTNSLCSGCLLEQQHLLDFEEVAARLQAVEIHPRRQAVTAVVGRVPLHDIPTRALVLGNQRPNHLTYYIIDGQFHVRRLRQRILDRRRGVERVRIVIRQREHLGPRLQLHRSRQHQTIEAELAVVGLAVGDLDDRVLDLGRRPEHQAQRHFAVGNYVPVGNQRQHAAFVRQHLRGSQLTATQRLLGQSLDKR